MEGQFIFDIASTVGDNALCFCFVASRMSLRDHLNPVSVQRACCLETSLQFLKLNKQAERSPLQHTFMLHGFAFFVSVRVYLQFIFHKKELGV